MPGGHTILWRVSTPNVLFTRQSPYSSLLYSQKSARVDAYVGRNSVSEPNSATKEFSHRTSRRRVSHGYLRFSFGGKTCCAFDHTLLMESVRIEDKNGRNHELHATQIST